MAEADDMAPVLPHSDGVASRTSTGSRDSPHSSNARAPKMGAWSSIGCVNPDLPNKMDHSNGLMSGWIWLWTGDKPVVFAFNADPSLIHRLTCVSRQIRGRDGKLGRMNCRFH